MGYEEAWMLLADLLTELKKTGETIPANIMKDLRSAKTMIKILKADPTHTENIPRVEIYLENLEFHLVPAAQKRFGIEFVDQWMKKLEEAKKRICDDEEEAAAPRFVPGIPRGERWIRVQVSKETPQRNIERLAEENKLSYRTQEDGYLLVYGSDEGIKSFIKRLSKKFRNARAT
ncbi:MAG: DUF2096 family protein [Candidatus Bathyarchaeota archaeon]|nr:MAG: DUF2096 family protein [Candidatus Bathyarchaeota archaeon]